MARLRGIAISITFFSFMGKPAHITILGGGPAGLAVGYFARKKGIPFTIYEAGDRIGGNCVTLEKGGFLFDSGAHRLHDQDPEATGELRSLLGEDLQEIFAPSHIYHRGKFIDFPLSPLNLVKTLGPGFFSRAGLELVRSRLRPGRPDGSFKQYSLRTYGKTITDLFLKDYSEKLWGASWDRLSAEVAGKRLKGLNLRTFVTEALFGRRAKTKHLDGSFYYPKKGIGTIFEALAERAGRENIRTGSTVTKIFHDHNVIRAVELNGREVIDTREVVSSLPLNLFTRILEPRPAEELLSLAQSLRYRNMILVAFFLNRESVTKSATVYFPDSEIPFTRFYEPRNRSREMSPPGKTSLVVEFPCQPEDPAWNLEPDQVAEKVRSPLLRVGLFREEEIIGTAVHKINQAYPILELGYEEKLEKVFSFLRGVWESEINRPKRQVCLRLDSRYDQIRPGDYRGIRAR